MSPRCQLRFTKEGTDRVAQVYRHSDGHPETILSNLQHLRRLLKATGSERDPGYTAAQYIFVDKLWQLEQTFMCEDEQYADLPSSVSEVLDIESWECRSYTPPYLVGHSIENPATGIHGDEEFLYVVELPPARVGDWTVKIAGRHDFPRWDDDGTEQAFEVADWQVDAPLEEALQDLERDA